MILDTMCMFSGAVSRVSNTRIFGRCEGETQLLAYAMHVSADAELAMVLPLPVVAGCGDAAVRFINLERYAELFDVLANVFPPPPAAAHALGYAASAASGLAVHDVGSFEASYVPSIDDFERLDARFRLSTQVWQALPQMSDYGFAVFKLKPGSRKVHPMAFQFPTRNPASVYFPTVHVHDGNVNAEASFDHELYCQPRSDASPPRGVELWERSMMPLGLGTSIASEGIVEERHVYRTRLRGMLRNADVFAAV
jgi:hypothetical protein